jgi:putative ABC transport system substrate-binding protein
MGHKRPLLYAVGAPASKILRGARPADLPVEGINKIELAINRKTLQAFGVTIPPALAVRADRVFEGIGE